ncbi:DNA-binding transcriptional regulator [Massilia sp. BJB1822]|uniref:helix-turn-helix domain-containing protein n=1 Tax=Massilia sp. BJB1822 TaxID=2744470 RepID=UPI00159323DF|nr:DNA-binding transcriptional regulator [Massilia sp. BJB1822]NVE00530.1 DNA-binding transcriptional regulator [Massilia sp. BJB1822]
MNTRVRTKPASADVQKIESTSPRQSRPRAKSGALEAIHKIAKDLHAVGAIDKETMRSFDASCLMPAPAFTPKKIAAIRKSAGMSQPVFAMHLGTSKSTIAKWESGEKSPSGPSRKLLEVVARHGIGILTSV